MSVTARSYETQHLPISLIRDMSLHQLIQFYPSTLKKLKCVQPQEIEDRKFCQGWGKGIQKGALVIRRVFSLVDMITKPKFSNYPYVFKIGLFR